MRQMANTAIWKATEGDRWFERNRQHIAELEKNPGTLVNIVTPLLHAGDKVLEVGCDGWQLRQLQTAVAGIEVYGADISQAAIADGKAKGTGNLAWADATDLPYASGRFDCIILGFVCYALGRRAILPALAEAERCIAEDGLLTVVDFLPDHPAENPYLHSTDTPFLAMKTDLAAVLVAFGGYQRIRMHCVLDSFEPIRRDDPGWQRVGITVLQRYPLVPDRSLAPAWKA